MVCGSSFPALSVRYIVISLLQTKQKKSIDSRRSALLAAFTAVSFTFIIEEKEA